MSATTSSLVGMGFRYNSLSPVGGQFRHFIDFGVLVRMIAVSSGALTRIKVMPKMPNNEDMPAASSGCLSVLACLLTMQSAWAVQPSSSAVTWKTGPKLEQQLDAIVGIHWASNPLRGALTRLSRDQGVAIFLDRRVDPDVPIEFSMQGMDLGGVLNSLAGRVQQGVCRVGPVVYIGPTRTSSMLATVVALKENESKQLPSAVRGRLRRSEPLRWPELTAPRELIDGLAAGVGLTVEGGEQIPHDLWPEVDLPPLTFAQRMSLVLAGFHMTFEIGQDDSTIRLMPMPETASMERSYPLRGNRANVMAVLSRRFPDANISAAAGKITVIGTVEEHGAIKRALEGKSERPTPAKSPSGGETVYSLKIKGRVGKLASGLATKLGLQLEFEQRAAGKFNEPVSLDVKEVSLEELLDALFSPAGLSYELTGKTLRVRLSGSS